MADSVKKIQELLDIAEQTLSNNNIQSRYILDISELKKMLPKTGLSIPSRVRALGGTRIGTNEYMFDTQYAPEKLARQLLAEARKQQQQMPQPDLFDRDFTSLGLAVARRGMSRKSFVTELPTGKSVINTKDIQNPDIRRDLERIDKILVERQLSLSASVERNLSATSRALGYLVDVQGLQGSNSKANEIRKTLEAKIRNFAQGDALETVTELVEQNAQAIFNGGRKPKTTETITAKNPKAKGPKATIIKPKFRVLANGRMMVTGQGFNRFASKISLITYLNALVSRYVAQNMGKGRELTYRTGRFANSVHVTSLVATRQQAVSVWYGYQDSPYQTFEPGWKQGHKGYDPRRLIKNSIRELLVEALGITNAYIAKDV